MKKNKKKHLNHMSECKTLCLAAMKQRIEMFAPMYRELDILAMSVEPMREYLLEVRQNAESVQTCMQVLISSIDWTVRIGRYEKLLLSVNQFRVLRCIRKSLM